MLFTRIVHSITVDMGRLLREGSLTCQKDAVVEFNLFEDLETMTRQEAEA